MKLKDIRDLSEKELAAKLNDAREELMKLRFQQASGELTDYNRMRTTRRTIARMETILTERAKAGMEGER